MSEVNQQRKYAVLMETSGKHFESWYFFIRYDGNEEALNHLQHNLEKVDFYILDELSTFDLELDHLVSEETAKQMCGLDLNATMFHRKFDGKMKKVHFEFSKRDTNDDRIEKINDKLGMGGIDEYVEDEDPCEDGYELRSLSESEDEKDEVVEEVEQPKQEEKRDDEKKERKEKKEKKEKREDEKKDKKEKKEKREDKKEK